VAEDIIVDLNFKTDKIIVNVYRIIQQAKNKLNEMENGIIRGGYL
jgi:hypothetical protein